MRTYDLSPLYRSTVGFDRLFSLLDQVTGPEQAPTYPPYNIERTGENNYRISVAVAGFEESELTIETKDNTLLIRGSREAKAQDSETAQPFERRFQLADHVQVTGASLRNGLLHVELVHEVPEVRKPRRIEIGSSTPRVVEGDARKAA